MAEKMKDVSKEIKNSYNFWERIFSIQKNGVNFVFEQNPELVSIGTKKQYEKYLKTIFPGRKVQNIVYHQTPKKFEGFNVNKSITGGIYFSPFNLRSGIFTRDDTKAALINIKNPFIISKKQNKKFERYLPNMSKLHKKVDLRQYDSVIGFSNISYDKGQLDSDILNISPNLRNNIEFVAFEPEQIHILGSKYDVGEFKKYMKNKKDNSLENKIISGIFIVSSLAGLFFLSLNVTGNVIGSLNKSSSNFIGIMLFLLGISGFFIYRKLRR